MLCWETEGEGLSKGGGGSEWGSSLIATAKSNAPAPPTWESRGGDRLRERNASFNRRGEINNSLSSCSGRRVVKNLKNPLSLPRPRESREEGI